MDIPEEKIAQFLSIAPAATAAEAKRYLTVAKGDIDEAVTKYLDNKSKDVNTFYAGGGSSSGQAIQAPKGSSDIDAESVFTRARELGAEDSAPSTQAPPFAGKGQRLGYTEGPSPAVAAQKTSQPRKVSVTFWKNGFSVDDGELRGMDDPQSQEFLQSMQKGFVPRELQHAGTEVDVQLVDRREQPFVKQFKAFGGSGQTLGGGSAAAQTAPAPAVASGEEYKPTINDGEATCSVMIQLANGKRVEAKVVPTRHTLGDLRRVAASVTGTESFDLMQRMPPKPLHDVAATISDMGIENSLVVQRMK